MDSETKIKKGISKQIIMQQLSIEIGKRIRQAREERGMSQQEVADRLNISRPQFTHYENGRNLIGLESLLKLPYILDKELMFFLGISDTGTLADLPPSILRIIEVLKTLGPDDKETVGKFVEYLSQKKGEYSE